MISNNGEDELRDFECKSQPTAITDGGLFSDTSNEWCEDGW